MKAFEKGLIKQQQVLQKEIDKLVAIMKSTKVMIVSKDPGHTIPVTHTEIRDLMTAKHSIAAGELKDHIEYMEKVGIIVTPVPTVGELNSKPTKEPVRVV